MIKVKDLKEFLKECDDNSIVLFEYEGCDFEIEDGDSFVNIELENSEINDRYVEIHFK